VESIPDLVQLKRAMLTSKRKKWYVTWWTLANTEQDSMMEFFKSVVERRSEMLSSYSVRCKLISRGILRMILTEEMEVL